MSTPRTARRTWVPADSEQLVTRIATETASSGPDAVTDRILALIATNALAQRLRPAGLLTSGIGLPGDADGVMGAIRLGTNEMVRWGMTSSDMATVAGFVARAVSGEPSIDVAADVQSFRERFDTVHFCS